MARFLKNFEKTMGQSPGSQIFIGTRKMDDVKTHMIRYDPGQVTERPLLDISDEFECKALSAVSWINICGLHDGRFIGKIGDVFGLHPLVVEDILNTGQRPKIEDFDTYIFIVLKMIRFDSQADMVVTDQLSIVLSDTFVLTFQEQPADVFDPVRERIRNKNPAYGPRVPITWPIRSWTRW